MKTLFKTKHLEVTVGKWFVLFEFGTRISGGAYDGVALSYFQFALYKELKFGFHNTWYDGDWPSLHLGPFMFSWRLGGGIWHWPWF